MKNKLSDLTNHLYAQLERLGNEELKGDDLLQECQRAEAMSKVANNIIGIGNISIKAFELVKNGNVKKEDLPVIFNDGCRTAIGS